MASKYDGLARIILQNVGGKSNITGIRHCVTRLRFNLKDESKANTDVLKETDGIVTVIQAGGQYQAVIGNQVSDVYDAVISVGHLEQLAEGLADESGNALGEGAGGAKPNLLNRFIDVISGCMQPILGCLGASGIVKGLLAFSVSMGWMDPSWGTYQVLYAFGDGFFYFLPIFLGYTCAKKLNFDEFIGMAIGVGLVYPNMVAMQGSSPLGTIFAGTAFEMSYTTTFLKLPVFFPASGYPSSVVPVLLASLVTAKWVYPFFRKIFPDTVKLFLVPLCTVCVMLPLTYLVVGPVSSLLCGALQWFFGLIFNLPVVGGAVAGALVGAFWQVLVMFGLHWGLIPLMYSNIGTLGYDIVLSPNNVCSWTEFGILAAVVLKTKSTKTRGIAIPAMISAFFGISEPAIYGITLPKKKPFLLSCVVSGIGGAVIGLLGVKSYLSGGLGLFAWPAFINPNPAPGENPLYSMLVCIVVAVIAVIVTFVITWFTYKDEPDRKRTDATPAQKAPVLQDERSDAPTAGADGLTKNVIVAPIRGEAKPLSECNDEVFNSGVMGQGVVIEPEEGRVYAPCDGEITNLFETLHAIGMSGPENTDLLIHVGMDTVGLNGQGFTAHVKTGDKVKAGQLLLEFDMDFIRSKGLPVTTPVVVTNSDDYPGLTVHTGNVNHGDTLIYLR